MKHIKQIISIPVIMAQNDRLIAVHNNKLTHKGKLFVYLGNMLPLLIIDL